MVITEYMSKRLKNTEDNELALLDSQWTEWPLPNGCSHHSQVHCPWLKGLPFAKQTLQTD